MKRILFFIFVLITCLSNQAQQLFTTPGPLPKYEVRAVWLTTLSGLDWPRQKATSPQGREAQKQELCQILDQLQQTGINTILLQTRVRGTVIYPSKIEPWDNCLTGQYDRDPGYDPLAFAIEQAHQRGMQLHAWVVTVPCFKIANAGKLGKKGLMATHPKLLRKHADTYYFDPGLPGVGDYLTSICREIASRYDVDGIHFDYIRYPENPGTFPDRDTYKRYAPKGVSKDDWRRSNITALVTQMHQAIKAIKPWIRVSCSPVGKYDDVSRFSARGWAAYSTVYQDAQGWLRQGVMDMLFPMMYFQGDHFYPFAADWREHDCDRPVVPGLGIYFLHPKEKDWEWGVVQRQLYYIRTLGLGGQAYFRSQFLTDNTKGIYDYLHDVFYAYPALIPPMTWQSSTLPAMPDVQVQRTGPITVDLSWQPVTQSGSPCRYIIYASRQAPVDTSDPSNIVAIVDQPQYTFNLLSATLWNLHLAVTTLDRFGLESQPAEIEQIL